MVSCRLVPSHPCHISVNPAALKKVIDRHQCSLHPAGANLTYRKTEGRISRIGGTPDVWPGLPHLSCYPFYAPCPPGGCSFSSLNAGKLMAHTAVRRSRLCGSIKHSGGRKAGPVAGWRKRFGKHFEKHCEMYCEMYCEKHRERPRAKPYR